MPLTIRLAYTPELLRALGIGEADLTLFTYDEQAQHTLRDGTTVTGRWMAVPTTVDAATGTATAQVDHFTTFQFADGTNGSTAYLPTLQGWQVSAFTGAVTFSEAIDVPAGPAGIKPSLALSYSSAASDGSPGMRSKQQAGWVGRFSSSSFAGRLAIRTGSGRPGSG